MSKTMSQTDLLKQTFLAEHTAEDINQSVICELEEFSCEHGTVFFGNGEAILSPKDVSEDETTLFVDRYGDRLVIVEG